MATLEDKILGEKLHNYCSSSEESDHEESSGAPEGPQPSDTGKWEGSSTNTGPKGVIEDWRKFKRLESEKREENQKECIELAKKLTMAVRTTLDEEKEAAKLEDPELAELLNDDFLVHYQKQRIEEMMQQTNLKKKFGELLFLRNGQDFLEAIDKEDKTVMVIVHIYEDHLEACRTMNHCLRQLCKIYDTVKFCAIVGSQAGVSKAFKAEGVPALLVYKAGNIVGNFVKLSNDLGDNFQTEDVQGFLVEHGLLEDKSLTPSLVKCSTAAQDSEESD